MLHIVEHNERMRIPGCVSDDWSILMCRVFLLHRLWLIGIIIFSFSFAHAQSRSATPQQTGSISGHVLIEGKAAAGVEVGAFGGSDSFNRRVATAQSKTDSEGYYHLSGLPAANYQVTTFTPNLIAAETDTQLPMGYGYFASSKTVLLAAGEDVGEIDIKLKRGGVITGRVTDADDKPVVEERISLQPVTDQGQTPIRVPMQVAAQMYQTDDRGIYRIYGLPPGRYRVSVGRPAAAGLASPGGFYLLTFHPDATDVSRAEAIDLAEGAEVGNVDIKVGARGETHAVNGRVVDAENGLPISGLRVGVMFAQGGSFSTGNATRADGTFTIQGLTRGQYNVYVSSDTGESDFYSDPVAVTVADEDVGGIELKALHGVSVSGTIAAENLTLRDLMQQVPGMRVTMNIVPADPRQATNSIRSYGSAAVGPDGSFTVTGLRPGRVSINLDARDSSKRPSITKVMVGGVTVSQGFEIERQPVSGIQLVVSYGTGMINGSVTFQGGTLSDFRTEVICRRDGARNTGGAYLDARGHFTMKALVPGTYDCYLQFISVVRPTSRPPQAPHQTVTVANDVEASVTILVDLTPKGVGP
jgi:hypothetical protein